MDKDEELIINPDTGRDQYGRFAQGNKAQTRRRKVSEVTRDLRHYADVTNLTIEGVKKLEKIMKNKDGKYSESAELKATELLIKHLTLSAKEEQDKDIADEGNKTISEMFQDLKGIK